MTQPCDIYDAPPYSTRCEDNSIYYNTKRRNCDEDNCTCRGNCPFKTQCTPYCCPFDNLKSTLPCTDEMMCKDVQVYKPTSNSNIMCDCKPKILKSCLKTPCNDCCCPRKCFIVMKQKKFIKTSALFIMLSLMLFAWFIDRLFTCTPKYHYRLW